MLSPFIFLDNLLLPCYFLALDFVCSKIPEFHLAPLSFFASVPAALF
jgi:hypothetical protein